MPLIAQSARISLERGSEGKRETQWSVGHRVFEVETTAEIRAVWHDLVTALPLNKEAVDPSSTMARVPVESSAQKLSSCHDILPIFPLLWLAVEVPPTSSERTDDARGQSHQPIRPTSVRYRAGAVDRPHQNTQSTSNPPAA